MLKYLHYLAVMLVSCVVFVACSRIPVKFEFLPLKVEIKNVRFNSLANNGQINLDIQLDIYNPNIIHIPSHTLNATLFVDDTTLAVIKDTKIGYLKARKKRTVNIPIKIQVINISRSYMSLISSSTFDYSIIGTIDSASILGKYSFDFKAQETIYIPTFKILDIKLIGLEGEKRSLAYTLEIENKNDIETDVISLLLELNAYGLLLISFTDNNLIKLKPYEKKIISQKINFYSGNLNAALNNYVRNSGKLHFDFKFGFVFGPYRKEIVLQHAMKLPMNSLGNFYLGNLKSLFQ